MTTNDEKISKSKIKEELNDDGDLLSLEKLDRSSPDLWPEKIPGLADFIAMSDTPIRTPTCDWERRLSEEDTAAIIELSNMTPNALIVEIKKIYHEFYLLGVEEAKQVVYGKYLGVFTNAKKK